MFIVITLIVHSTVSSPNLKQRVSGITTLSNLVQVGGILSSFLLFLRQIMSTQFIKSLFTFFFVGPALIAF